MQHTTCTEDRIQHALDRCLDGLSPGYALTQSWNGLCMNRWSLEELVRRYPDNFLILLQQILRKAREVQELCQYELVAPLAIMFSSTLLQTPHIPPDSQLLPEAYEVFHRFLTWPEPYSGVCRELLSVLRLELKAPGISYQRLVREEQGLITSKQRSKTMTVLLMNPVDVPTEFLSMSEQLSHMQQSQEEAYVTLIRHAYQATLGAKYSLHGMQKALQSKSVEELEKIFSSVTELLETSASMEDSSKARVYLQQGLEALKDRVGIQVSNGRRSEGLLQTLPLPIAKSYMYKWDKDNFDILNNILNVEQELATRIPCGDQEEEEDEEEEQEEQDEEQEDLEEEDDLEEAEAVVNGCMDHRASTISTFSTVSKDSMFSTISIISNCSMPSVMSVASGTDSDFCEDPEDSPPERSSKSKARLSKRFSMLFKSRSSHSLNRAKSLGSPETKDFVAVRSQRSNSLPQQAKLLLPEQQQQRQSPKPVCFRRRPILSCDDDGKATTLRVVVFGADHAAGKVARAYSNLRLQESACPLLTRVFNLQFFFIPVRRSSSNSIAGCPSPGKLSESPLRGNSYTELSLPTIEDSTNDIARFIGMLDPWYERNMLSLLRLPVDVLCQQTTKAESDSGSSGERPSILADLVLYYCRNAGRPVLVQLYQAELTLAGGEKRTEVFIHSLELGHAAGTRAVKALGAASKRFGIDGDREAVPLSLEVVYNKVGVSGRSQWLRTDKVCTSISLTKACRRQEELDSKMERLQLTMTEVLKRQNSKSKKGYNQQLSTTEVKVDKVQVFGSSSTTFPVCLDQDEKKIFQSVTRCDVSVCYKPDGTADRRLRRVLPSHTPPPNPTFCSLLCLPVATFGGAQP
ncbi:phosphoinositide 3-kinase regulatory subunit 5 [Scleropages formosus]|uniref:Phosphoinositide 3-kinase regulatory subunit 5 n=1 Tax=Scleropages formosus TaxID=113540 RepID=A0A8C9R7H8_SCLFO|nr:phosphoinositide 3-kinase regulatory subunit 5 [Scleropages formosus]